MAAPNSTCRQSLAPESVLPGYGALSRATDPIATHWMVCGRVRGPVEATIDIVFYLVLKMGDGVAGPGDRHGQSSQNLFSHAMPPQRPHRWSSGSAPSLSCKLAGKVDLLMSLSLSVKSGGHL